MKLLLITIAIFGLSNCNQHPKKAEAPEVPEARLFISKLKEINVTVIDSKDCDKGYFSVSKADYNRIVRQMLDDEQAKGQMFYVSIRDMQKNEPCVIRIFKHNQIQ